MVQDDSQLLKRLPNHSPSHNKNEGRSEKASPTNKKILAGKRKRDSQEKEQSSDELFSTPFELYETKNQTPKRRTYTLNEPQDTLLNPSTDEIGSEKEDESSDDSEFPAKKKLKTEGTSSGASTPAKKLGGKGRKGKRERIEWTQEEDAALKEGVDDFGIGNWTAIFRTYRKAWHPDRTAPNLKDRWRVIARNTPTKSPKKSM